MNSMNTIELSEIIEQFSDYKIDVKEQIKNSQKQFQQLDEILT